MSDSRSPEDAVQAGLDSRIHEFIKIEYKYLTEQFVANEEMGEKRVALFVSLTAGLGAAAVLTKEKLGQDSPVSFLEIFIAVTVVWLLFGYLTFLRVVHRNIRTDEYKKQLRMLRKWFVKESDIEWRALLPYDPYGALDKERAGLRFRSDDDGRGGYAELVGLINSVVAGALAWQVSFLVLGFIGLTATSDEHIWLNVTAFAVAVVVAVMAWRWHSRIAAASYQKARQSVERKA